MPYNDLDLYTMGLLDPAKVKPSFVIQNPTLEDGRKLRMHSSGNLVEIQNPDGTWSGPFYLPTGVKVKGTRKTISLSDITALEGPRDPAFPDTQKDFKVAFIFFFLAIIAHPLWGMEGKWSGHVRPIFRGIATGKHWCGKFLKDYSPVDW